MKICKNCGKELEETFFYSNSRICKACVKEKAAQRRKPPPENLLARLMRYEKVYEFARTADEVAERRRVFDSLGAKYNLCLRVQAWWCTPHQRRGESLYILEVVNLTKKES